MTNLEIAQSATLKPIEQIAEEAGLSPRWILPYGRSMAKLAEDAIEFARSRPQGKLILVTAITPTPAGEGKTTTTIGLAQGLRRLGRSAIPATREPALGPIFGIKGGACGGGYSQVLPMEEINLFFTGDFPAVSAAHNLLSAMLDAHVHNGNALGIDVRSVFWPRTVDMNDRALRQIVVGLGGRANGYPREDGFVVTPASEVMATLCLSRSLQELKRRLGCIIVAERGDRSPVTARDLQANGAMAALLKDAIKPNLVQTIEGGPAFVHGGPFGNIAHGCSSIIATECGLGLAEYLVTEAGFGSDLGGEKFLNIVCRELGRGPDAIVLVATIRALKHHGGSEDTEGLERGLANLFRHIAHLRHYGPPIVVAVNRFPTDTREEFEIVREACASVGVRAVWADPFGRGGEGCLELGEAVIELSSQPSEFRHLYPTDTPLDKMIEAVAKRAYGAASVSIDLAAQRRLRWAAEHRCSLDMVVCIAKTQYSFSHDPKLLNAPEDFEIEIREVRTSAGAGFVVALAGDIMLMPGLGKEPNAAKIDVDEGGRLVGLF
ncbi:MAG: formate--tetrahydrofolate ligase [Fimbriimonadales bacterium]|nr:formate--tetrahydrofolate ligase [Fimbriimonadales bacterium]